MLTLEVFMKILSDQELVAKYNCFKTCLAGGGIWGTSPLVLWADVGFGVLGNPICKSNEPFWGEGQRSKLPVVWFSCLMLFGSSTVRTSNPGNQCAWTKVAICRSGDREPTWLSQSPWTVTLSHCHTVMEFAFHASEFDLSLPRSQLQDFKTWLRDRAWVS